MGKLGKPFPKKSDKKFQKTKFNVKMPHVNKNHQREMEIWLKQKN